MSEAAPMRPRKRIEKHGRVYEEKKWSELSFAEWNEVAKQLALVFVLAPSVLLGAADVATDPKTIDLATRGINSLKDSLTSRLPKGFLVRKMEGPDGKTIAIVAKQDVKTEKTQPKVNFEIVFPNADPSQKVTVQFGEVEGISDSKQVAPNEKDPSIDTPWGVEVSPTKAVEPKSSNSQSSTPSGGRPKWANDAFDNN